MKTYNLTKWYRIGGAVVVLLIMTMCSSVSGQEQGSVAAETPKKELSAQTEAQIVTVVNSYCPITGNVIETDRTPVEQQRTFKNQQVGFWLVDCLAAWDKLTAFEKDAKLKKVWPIINSSCPITGKQVDTAKIPDSRILIHAGQRVGFCSTECVPAWDKLSASEKDAKLKKGLLIVNTFCPMTNRHSIDPNKVPDSQTLIYKGQKVGFCSNQCLLDWDKLSVAQKDAKLKKVLPVANSSCPISGDPIAKVKLPISQTQMFLGPKIGFCSMDCIEKWNKLTIEEKENKLKNAMLPAAKQEVKPASHEKLE